MKTQESELLLGICRVLAKSFIDMAEFHNFPKTRTIQEYEIRLRKIGLCCVPYECPSKRLRIARKLDAYGLVSLNQHRKGGTWNVKFTSLELSKNIYQMACESLKGFDFNVGNGWVSYPQFSKTPQGFSELERIAQYAFEILSKVEELSA